ncbi:MAG TPA: LytTR family DNA-binding domain-containing protein [Tenuifilaceae bacterium]|nr:LytTR family DNA-binding domain-containing protein [Tenuifilaceae bacterium]HPI45145.1 LytTR family DNA-binding domain-containing protein [Tenuifilaceae bacterium]HPN21212.1 LytTR family DNA-binding domain-containing protein [Tenuifilaceae bacterium]
MLKALIVDDEIASVRTLELLLSQFAKDVEVVDVARSASEALTKVDLIHPDIVFLDIEMPGGSGFDFLEQCNNRTFDVIFITAFEYYAVKAFKYSAIDYLLKPIEIEELESALTKVSNRRYSNFDGKNRYFALFENLKSILPSKLVVTIKNRSEYVDLKDIAYFQSNINGSKVVKLNGEFIDIDNKLSNLEEILDSKFFARINDKQLVNLKLVKKIGRNGKLDMDKGLVLDVANEYLGYLVEQLEELVNSK